MQEAILIREGLSPKDEEVGRNIPEKLTLYPEKIKTVNKNTFTVT